jgi:ribonuclease-3
MNESGKKLEAALGYSFKDPELLRRALTHRSRAHENHPAKGDAARLSHNEALEFLGDSVLGLAVAELLYRRHPSASEGELTLMKHHLVSTAMLAQVAERLSLGERLLVGRGEEKTGGRKKQALLADALEAVIGAIFYESGYQVARQTIAEILAAEIENVTASAALDYKTLLQEKLQAQKRAAPVYAVKKTEGPPHQRMFYVEAAWDAGKTSGEGRSIKSAEMQAARAALEEMENEA